MENPRPYYFVFVPSTNNYVFKVLKDCLKQQWVEDMRSGGHPHQNLSPNIPGGTPSHNMYGQPGGPPFQNNAMMRPNPAVMASPDAMTINQNILQFVPSLSEDDDELTESKIRAFLDDKALELKRLQIPLYEEFYNSVVPSCSIDNFDIPSNGSSPNYLKLPPKSKSPNRFPLGTPFKAPDAVSNGSPGSGSRRTSNVSGEENMQSHMDLSSPQFNDMNGAESQQEASSPGMDFSEVHRKWKEELDQELERKREMMRQVGVGGKTSSPIDRGSNRQRERSRFASPGK